MWICRTQRRQTIDPTRAAAIEILRGAGLGASTYGVDQGSNDDDGNADAAAEMETLLFA